MRWDFLNVEKKYIIYQIVNFNTQKIEYYTGINDANYLCWTCFKFDALEIRENDLEKERQKIYSWRNNEYKFYGTLKVMEAPKKYYIVQCLNESPKQIYSWLAHISSNGDFLFGAIKNNAYKFSEDELKTIKEKFDFNYKIYRVQK